MLPTLIFFVCAYFWYVPVYKKQGQINKLSVKPVIGGILLGGFLGIICILIVQIGIGYLIRPLKQNPILYYFADSFVSAALVEESVKFLIGRGIIRKTGVRRKVDYILLMGSVGLGYEIIESLMGGIDNLFAALIRGGLALHIMWQFQMGSNYYEYLRCKDKDDKAGRKEYWIKAFFVPFFLHGLNDFAAFTAEPLMLSDDETKIAAGFFILLASIVIMVITSVKISKNARRVSAESAAAEMPEDSSLS